MEIKLTRHAKNRIRLYDIPLDALVTTIKFPDKKEEQGENMIAVWKTISDFYLKIIYIIKKNRIIVITVIPLKTRKQS